MSHVVKHATVLEKLFKRKPPTPAPRPGASIGTDYRSFDTPAQIQAFCDAFFDRVKYRNGDVDDPEIVEPGLEVRKIGYLDLDEAPEHTPIQSPWDGFSLAPTVFGRKRGA